MANKTHQVEWKLKIGAEGGQEVKALQKDLQTLGQIDAFSAQHKKTREAQAAWKQATADVAALSKQLAQTAAPTKAMAAELDRARATAGKLKDQFQSQGAALNTMRSSLREAGVNTSALAQAQIELKRRISEAADSGVAKVDGLSGSFGSARSAASLLAASWDKLVGVAAGLVAFTAAAKSAITFETALIDLRRAANLSKDETSAMGDEIMQLAEELGMGSVAVAQLATAAAKAGVAKGDLLEFSRIAATAAINFDMIPEEAGDALAKLKTILKIGIGDMEAFVAEINELADNAATSERDIIEALKYGGGSAIQFGLTAKESAALAASFLSLGASAEQAGTAMRTMLGRLRLASSGAGVAGKALQSAVGDTKQFAKVMASDASSAVDTFVASVGKLPSAQRFQVLRDIFQDGLDTENISKLADNVDLLRDAMGRAQKSDDALVKSLRELTNLKLGSTQSELDKMGAAWRNAGAAIGELFLPAIRGVSIALVYAADGIRAVANTAPALSTLAIIGTTVALAWAPLRLLFSALSPVVARIAASFSGVTTIFRAFTTSIAAGTGIMAAARIGIAGIGRAIAGLMGPVGWAITALGLLWDAWTSFGKDSGTDSAVVRRAKAFDTLAEAMRGIGDALAQAKNQIQVAMQDALAPIESLTGNFKEVFEQLKSSMGQQLTDLDTLAKQRIGVLQQSGLSERALATETARITIEAEQGKAAAIAESGRQMEAAWSQTYGRALEMARTAGTDTAKIEQDAVNAKKEIYLQLEGAYRKTVDVLIGEEQRHLSAARDIENQRLALKMSVEDKLRALSQKTMSDEMAYADRVAQINDKIAKAREASAKGQADMAKRLADEAISLAQSNANEVVSTISGNGSRVQSTIVSMEQAVQTSKGQIQAAYGIIDQTMATTAEQEKGLAKSAADTAKDVQANLDTVVARVREINESEAVKVALKVSADEAAAKEAITQLQLLADAQRVQVRMEADLQKVNTALLEWKQNPDNTAIALKAQVALEDLNASTASLQTSMSAANLQIPAGLDTTTARESFDSLRETLNTTKTTSKHKIVSDAPEVLGQLDELDGHDTESTHTVKTTSKHKIVSDAPEVLGQLDELDGHDTESTHTVHVVYKDSGGGSVSSSGSSGESSGESFGSNSTYGGQSGYGYARGGRVGFAGGGKLPGYSPGVDNLLGMLRSGHVFGLSGGEDVTNARSTQVIYQTMPGLMPLLNRVRSSADVYAVLLKALGGHAKAVPDISRLTKNMQGYAQGGIVRENYRVTLAVPSAGVESTVTTSSKAEATGLVALAKALDRARLVGGKA